jgi:predicted membrane channel-forming protein YqfA (hemolysin III family)
MNIWHIIGLALLAIAALTFLYIALRSKYDIDFLQEYSPKLSKIINSSDRLAMFVLVAYTLLYISYQVLHSKDVDTWLVTTLLSVGVGGKVVSGFTKKDKAPPSQ